MAPNTKPSLTPTSNKKQTATPPPATTAPPMVSTKRSDDVKIKCYLMFEASNLAHPIYQLAAELPLNVKEIIAAFVARLGQRTKAKLNITRTLEYSKYLNLFDDVQCEDIENDYEDLGPSGNCPMCNKTIDAPYNYVEVSIGKSTNMIFSLKLAEHLLNDHGGNISFPPQFVSFVFQRFFTNLAIIKPISEMTKEELIAELINSRRDYSSLAAEVALLKQKIEQPAKIDAKAIGLAMAGELTINADGDLVEATEPAARDEDEELWREVREEVGDITATKSGEGNSPSTALVPIDNAEATPPAPAAVVDDDGDADDEELASDGDDSGDDGNADGEEIVTDDDDV